MHRAMQACGAQPTPLFANESRLLSVVIVSPPLLCCHLRTALVEIPVAIDETGGVENLKEKARGSGV